MRWPSQPGTFSLAGLPNGPFEIDVSVPGQPAMRVGLAGPNVVPTVLLPE